MASSVLVLAIATPLHAQGKGNGNGNAHKSGAPSSIPLPSPTIGPASSASPLAWLDDASLLAPGLASLTTGISRWSGADLSQVDFPLVEAAVGLTPRFQMGASVTHIVGSADGTGPAGGVGTSYISGKIALLDSRSRVKLALSPVLQILGAGAVQPDGSRAQIGLPVNAEVVQGPARLFASTGFFSQGSWFAGGGVSAQATPKVGMVASFTRSWSNDSVLGVPRNRQELSGGVSYAIRARVGAYAALGRTIATSDEDGAGTTLSGGISVLLDTPVTK
jgi:hypothetical protein